VAFYLVNGQKTSLSKHNKSRKKIERQMDKQQLHFLDAGIFIGTLFVEKRKKDCDDLLYSFKSKQRQCLTSTHSIGEVIKKIYTAKLENPKVKTAPLMKALDFIISAFEIEIYNVNDDTLELVKKAMASDKVCGFKDCINIALSYQYGCVCFHTTDGNISPQTLHEFEMKKKLIS